MASQIRHLRSGDADKRPAPEEMVFGQLAVNYSTGSPAVFFKDSAGGITKAGPIHVGTTAPNATPAGSAGNSVGEGWLDTSATPPILKVWTGAAWAEASGSGSAGCWVGDQPPAEFEQGSLWWNSELGILFVWYDDGDTQQWVEASPGTPVDTSNFVKKTGDTMSGALAMPLGSAAAPSVYFDAGTGLYSPGEDQLALATAGLQRVAVDAGGNVGIGTATPALPLDVQQSRVAATARFVSTVSTHSCLVGLNNDAGANLLGIAYGSAYSAGSLLNVGPNGSALDARLGSLAINVPLGQDIRFGIANNEKARITTDAYFRLSATSPGIQFNGDTAAANALDDYEEGTFVPTVVGMTTAGTATYGTQLGRYIKIGQMVHFTFVVSYSAHTGTGNMRINGLPFPALNLTNYNIPVSFRNDNIVSPANTLIQGYIQPNTVNVVLEAVAFATNNPVALALDPAGYFAVSGSYYANV